MALFGKMRRNRHCHSHTMHCYTSGKMSNIFRLPLSIAVGEAGPPCSTSTVFLGPLRVSTQTEPRSV